ncbi:elongation factor P 5-aminopentanone reductase [Thalassobacillus sp. CUG 92003]|uniref:elongation factor P 5-aminopentanone reductase n=1 Tax=Thalassobacillus sp. CUG 92003 TaxID=2736641 RepID=UPI0015E64653|nr:SDR family oxidoreductase [Thalassobacillus sp. CUG 92003]
MSRNCLILGASGGIGKATALQLAESGYNLCLQYYQNAHHLSDLQDAIHEDQWLGAIQADLSCSEGIQSFIAGLPYVFDAVVFTGGTSLRSLLQDSAEADMDKLYHLHVKSVWRITQHLLPDMLRKQEGHIIIVSSIWGEEGGSMESLYSSVKGAQISFVKALAKEVAPNGVYVNGVTPGFIDTAMNQSFNESDFSAIQQDIPMGRVGRPGEVARAVDFLLSERASYINGHLLKVNGAWN